MLRALLPLLASCLVSSVASIDGHSLIGPPNAAVTVLDAAIESVPGPRHRRLDANRSFLDHEDFYGFLVAVHPLPSFSDVQPFACTGTLIHVDAFLTSSRCKDFFFIGSVIKFTGGGDESSIVRQVSQIRLYKSLRLMHDGSLDLLVVFLESQSSAPSTVWKHATRMATRDDKHGYTSFSHFSDPSLNVTALELASRDVCDSALPNDLSRSNDTNDNDDSIACASTKAPGVAVAVVGAPILNNDNSLLGVVISGSCESMDSCTKDTTSLLQFVRISIATDEISRALCDSSQFPLDSCTTGTPHPARQSSTMGATRRWLAASVSNKGNFMSRLLTWLRQVLSGSPPDRPPVASPPIRPPTRAPTKPPTRAPATTAPLAPLQPSPTKAPAKAPTQMPVKPPTLSPATSPTRTPLKAPTSSPAKAPTLSPVKPSTPAPIKPQTPAPVKPPTRAPMVPRPSEFPSFEPTSFTIPPTRVPVRPPKSPVPPPQPVPTPLIAPKAPAAVIPTTPLRAPAAAPWPPPITCMPPSPKCLGAGRNLMQKFCLTQCVAEENVRRKRKAGWRCGECS